VAAHDRVSTGSAGFDQVIDGLRLGDNVVWQVDSLDDYARMVDAYVTSARQDGRRVVYVRFGTHDPLVADGPDTVTYRLDPTQGFEMFATEVHDLAAREGLRAFYVFDCLTDLLDYWHSDLMIGNFFKITCPFLYELDTVAYFAIVRGMHTYSTIATIRETTQLLLDLYRVEGKIYIHPLKVWQRYSPTMFFPHLIRGDEAISITASTEVADLFSSMQRQGDRLDRWTVAFDRAREALELPSEAQEPIKRSLIDMLIGGAGRMADLCLRYFTLADVLAVASREVGTGRIGGKSVGMLLARKILQREGGDDVTRVLEPHDSYYIGSDVFYTYVVQNGWWHLRAQQRTSEGYYAQAAELQEKMLSGVFPRDVREQFVEMLEYYGQSPIIVRSSSLLEDDFGNAFAGKYQSVFCANQGTPEERYRAFESAVREVYASTMSQEALDYRAHRGLTERDEQMAVLVQRVSGDRHGEYYFPHVAGVGNSENLYIWDHRADPHAGMLRLVLGLGTRAVDRTVGDYARIVCLDDPQRLPPMAHGDEKRYSQHGVDVLSLRENAWCSRRFEEVLRDGLKADESLFVSADAEALRLARELGRPASAARMVDFKGLLAGTGFAQVMRRILSVLSAAYDHPVDVEFTANVGWRGDVSVNVVQCRPLQTRGLGAPVPMPVDPTGCLFLGRGNFMGGNVRIPLDYVVYVRPHEYLALAESDKFAVARHIGKLNAALKGKSVMLLGPGRWGTTTPALGVPLRFAEMANMAVIGEVAWRDAGFSPELSYGSHFFQDLVESGIFYVALPDSGGVELHPEGILARPNELNDLAPAPEQLAGAIHVAQVGGMEVWSDIATQTVLCL
jgi:pyruvate,water dikinase